jgi:hypothetical protein
MHGFYNEFEATLPATNCYFITADQTLFLHLIVGDSVSGGFSFYVKVGSKENYIGYIGWWNLFLGIDSWAH